MIGEQTEFDKMLFGKRDEEMAKKIVSVLEKQAGTYFLVVGAVLFWRYFLLCCGTDY